MRKKILTTLQVLATIGILAWLFRDPEQNRTMWEALKSANWRWFAAALAAIGVLEGFAVARWQVLLRVQGIAISWARLTALVMIGLLFNLIMPGGTGGDVAKVYYLLKETPGREPAALLALLMDRVIGLVALIFLGAIVFAFRYEWLMQTPLSSGIFLGLVGLFAFSLASLGGAFIVTSLGWVNKLPKKLPMREKIVELSVAYQMYGKAWRSSLLAFLLSIPVHLFSYLLVYFVAQSFVETAKKISMWDCMAILPIINTITALPATIGGSGTREFLFREFFGSLCGVSAEMATVVSLTVYMGFIVWGLAGGIVYLFYRPTVFKDGKPETPEKEVVEA